MSDLSDYLDVLNPPPVRRGFASSVGLGTMSGPAWNNWAAQIPHGDATPLFNAVEAVTRDTTALRQELQRRVAPATMAFQGEYRVHQMPAGPGGACPPLGALDYVYPDLFASAQANLKRLADDSPRRGAPGTLVRRWATLIRWNIHLMYHASNIRHRFLFPTSTDPANTNPDFDFRGTSLRTKRTNVSVGSQGADIFGYRNGAPVGGAELLWEIRGGPQSVTDLIHRAVGPFGSSRSIGDARNVQNDAFLIAGTLRPEIRLDKTYTASNGAYVRPDGSTITSSSNSRNLAQREAEGRQFDSDLAYSWTSPSSRDFEHREPSAVLPYSAPLLYIEIWRETARLYSEVSLDQLLLDALGFYVFNHNVYWMAQLGLSPEQVAESQRAASQASLRTHPATATISVASTAVFTAINPIVAVIYGILQSVGMELLRPFLLNNIEYAAPYALFVRVPHPGCISLTPEAMAEEMSRRAAANRTDAAGLPLSTDPGPIVLTPRQQATLFEIQSRGNLTPSQQALLTRPLIVSSDEPPPVTPSGKGGLVVGVALLGLLALFSRRR